MDLVKILMFIVIASILLFVMKIVGKIMKVVLTLALIVIVFIWFFGPEPILQFF